MGVLADDYSDFKNEPLKVRIQEEDPFYLDMADAVYESWLRQHEIYDHPDLPAPENATIMIKQCLVNFIYMNVTSSESNPTMIQSFDTSPTLNQNPMDLAYQQAHTEYNRLIVFVNKDSLLQRTVRSGGSVGTRRRG